MIIIGSNNKGKVEEIKNILSPIEVKSLKDVGIKIEVVEDGNSFLENALIKARAIYKLTGETVIADDSGIEIDYLDGAPGVKSSRFLGEDTPYDIKNKKIVDMLEGVEGEKRSCRFKCVIVCYFGKKDYIATEGVMEGYILKEAVGSNGFGYDPIFLSRRLNKCVGMMNSEEKNKVSHRGEALRELKNKLKERGYYEDIINE